MIRLRAKAASTSHSLPLPPPIILSHTRPDAPSSRTPPLYLLSTDCRTDRPEVTLPPQKRLGIALGPRYEVGKSSYTAAARPAGGLRVDYGFVATMDREIRRDLERDVGYGITDSWDEIVEAMQGTLVVTDVAEFSQRMTEFEIRVRQDTYEIYTRLDDEQSKRHLMAGRLNMFIGIDVHTLVLLGSWRLRPGCGSTEGSDYRATGSRPQEIGGDYRDAGGRPKEAEVVHRGTEAAEETSDSDDRVRETARTCQRATRSNLALETTNTTSVTNAQLQAMINQGVTAALAARDANRSTNGDDSHNSGTCVRRTERVAREFENQVKFATCTLHLVALTWGNTHVKTVDHDAAYGSEGEGRMFPKEFDKIEKYVGGLPDMIHGSVVASKPKIMQEAVEIATELMDKKIRTFAERQTESKRKQDDNQEQQQQ
ncbi:hypothetical protein Tco_1382289 [Tanacetum coccineum]